jgi:hypothetical protein
MGTLFIILAGIILLIAGLRVYVILTRPRKPFRGELKPLEKSLFEELAKNLPPEAGELVPGQLACLKRGDRIYFEKSFSLELYPDKNNPLPENILFNRKDEFQLATIAFTVAGTKYKAQFSTYSGRLWGMTIRPRPKKLLNRRATSFGKFTLNNDPMEKLDLEIITEYYSDTDKINGGLSELMKDHNITQVKKPLPEKQRQLFIKLTDTKLPEDYLSLCDQTNGFEIDGASVFGLGALQSVALEDNNYLMLAEKEGGCLVIKQSKRSVILQYHSYEDETDVKNLEDNFIQALKTFVTIE